MTEINTLHSFIDEIDPNRIALAMNAQSMRARGYDVDTDRGTFTAPRTVIYRIQYRDKDGSAREEYLNDTTDDATQAKRLQRRLNELRQALGDDVASYSVFQDNKDTRAPRAFRPSDQWMSANQPAVAAAIQFLGQRAAAADEDARRAAALERTVNAQLKLEQGRADIARASPEGQLAAAQVHTRIAQAKRATEAAQRLQAYLDDQAIPSAVRTAMAAALEEGDVAQAETALRRWSERETVRGDLLHLPPDLASEVRAALQDADVAPTQVLAAARQAARQRAETVRSMLESGDPRQVRTALSILREQPELRAFAPGMVDVLPKIDDAAWSASAASAAHRMAQVFDEASMWRDARDFTPDDITSGRFADTVGQAAEALAALASGVDPRVPPAVVRQALVRALTSAGFLPETAEAILAAALPHLAGSRP